MGTGPQRIWEAPLSPVTCHAAPGRGLWVPPRLPACPGRSGPAACRGWGVLVAPPEGRIGVEHLVAVAQEAAVTGHLGGLLTAEQAWFGPVVAGQLGDRGIQGDLEVVVDVAAVGGIPPRGGRRG